MKKQLQDIKNEKALLSRTEDILIKQRNDYDLVLKKMEK